MIEWRDGTTHHLCGYKRAAPHSPLGLTCRPSFPALPPCSADVGRLGTLFAGVIANLQQPLLNDVNIKCSSAGGQPQLHRCREQAERQFAAWAGGPAAAAPDMQALLAHVNQVEVCGW